MPETKWMIKAREYSNCNCMYGCPCQFSGTPTEGSCQAIVGFEIGEGFHGETKLDGLRVAGMFRWPGAIHEGHGEAAVVVDERASDKQRDALLRILTGQDTKPGATIFQVFSTTLEKVHPPIFAPIDFQIDIDKRRARIVVRDHIDSHGEPILNPVTGAEARARIDIVGGFEYTIAEIGRGWSKATSPMVFENADTYGHFCELNLCQDGIVP